MNGWVQVKHRRLHCRLCGAFVVGGWQHYASQTTANYSVCDPCAEALLEEER